VGGAEVVYPSLHEWLGGAVMHASSIISAVPRSRISGISFCLPFFTPFFSRQI
jgi:hypothetical protein